MGGTEDTVTIKGNEDEWDMEVTAEQENPASSVDWLDNNVIMTGNWAGAVSLIDLRVKQRALRFQHPAGIVRIKKLGCNQIIVAGSSNAVSIFTLLNLILSSLIRNAPDDELRHSLPSTPIIQPAQQGLYGVSRLPMVR